MYRRRQKEEQEDFPEISKRGSFILNQVERLSRQRGDDSEFLGRRALEELKEEGWFITAHFSRKWSDWDREGIDAMIYAYDGSHIKIDFKSSEAGVRAHLERAKELPEENRTVPILIKRDESREELKQRIVRELGLERPFWLEGSSVKDERR